MTNIDDLQERISSAEAVLEALKTELQELKNQEPEQESLFGRWATAPNGQRVLIVEHEWDEDGLIAVVGPTHAGSRETEKIVVSRDQVTLDPATLTTEQDFENAPVGTVVEEIGNEMETYMKFDGAWGVAGLAKGILHRHMPACRVIRWGNGQ